MVIKLENINPVVKLIAYILLILVLLLSKSIISMIGIITLLIILIFFDNKSTNIIKTNYYNTIPSLLIFLIFLLFSGLTSAIMITLKYIIFINYVAIYIKNTSERDLTDSIIYILRPLSKIINTYRVANSIVKIMKWLPNYNRISAKLKYRKEITGYDLNSSKVSSNIKDVVKNHYHTFIITCVSAINLEKNMQIRAADVPCTSKPLTLRVKDIDIGYLAIHLIVLIITIMEVII